MNIQYRRLTVADIDTFIDIRINRLQEEGEQAVGDLRQSLIDD